MAHRDDLNQKLYEKRERQKKKSAAPQNNRNIDPGKVTHHDAGKGDKIRDMKGWYSDEVSDTLEKIFGKKKWKKKLDGEEEETKTEHDDKAAG